LTPSKIPVLTYKQVGIFLDSFVKATTSLEWHFERGILTERPTASERIEIKMHDTSATKTQMYTGMETGSAGRVMILTSKDTDKTLLTHVQNYDYMTIA
jgi:hypothetical protein